MSNKSISQQEETSNSMDDYEFREDQRDQHIFKINRNFRTQDGLENDEKSIKINYNRKEKSLEELSKKFLQIFQDKNYSEISLDEITNQLGNSKLCLGVERRRIYDIINILESLNMVSKMDKNRYRWNGFETIDSTLSKIKEQDVQFNDQNKRKKNLESLSIGFVKTFLKYKRIVTLEDAAKYIQPDNNDKLKTQIRRLYDIANVFKSLGLIKKVHLCNKKPAFEWIKSQTLFENQELTNLYYQLLQKSNSLKQNPVVQIPDKQHTPLVKRKTHILILDENFQTHKKIKPESQQDNILRDSTNRKSNNKLYISEISSFSSCKKIQRDINFDL